MSSFVGEKYLFLILELLYALHFLSHVLVILCVNDVVRQIEGENNKSMVLIFEVFDLYR